MSAVLTRETESERERVSTVCLRSIVHSARGTLYNVKKTLHGARYTVQGTRSIVHSAWYTQFKVQDALYIMHGLH